MPEQNPTKSTSYRSKALLSLIAKTLYKIILPHNTNNIQIHTHQHGFTTERSLHYNSHQTINTTTTCFNKKKPPARNIAIARGMSKAFDTVHLHKLLHKITQTNMHNTVKDSIKLGDANSSHFYNNTKSKQTIKTGVSQRGVLSPTLFNILIIPSLSTGGPYPQQR